MTTENRTKFTINDVARMAGVSKRTVSRVLNDSPKVNPETREKIQQIIASLEYRPSKQARGLASSRSYLLGLIYDDPNAIFIHSVQKGILGACASHGYEMVVHPSSYQSRDLIPEILEFVSRSKLDGLVILPPISANGELAAALRNESIPYVLLAARSLDSPERMVISDDRQGMGQVAELFVTAGCASVGVVLGPSHRLASEERYEGLKSELANLGVTIDPDLVVEGDFSYESGLRCAETLLTGARRPDAIFASNDQMAVAVIHKAQDLGIDVPGELLVVGYDDDPMAKRLRPSLSTLQRPNEEMARAATFKLIAAITGNGRIGEDVKTVFVPRLICRDSTGAVGSDR